MAAAAGQTVHPWVHELYVRVSGGPRTSPVPLERSDVENDGGHMPRIEGMPPWRHQTRQADARSSAANHIRQVRVQLALLKRRIAEIARVRVEVERVETIALAGIAVTADAVG